MSKIKIEKKDIIWSYIGNFLKLSINIILLPIILHYLTDEELGMWYVFASIGQLIILLDFGFAPSLARNIAYVWCGARTISKTNVNNNNVNEGIDKEYFNVVLNTCKYIYIIIAVCALILMLSLGSLYITNLSNNVNYLYAWIIYSFGAFFNILYSYYASFLHGIGAIAERNKSAIASKLVQIVITLTTLLSGSGLIGVSIAYFLSGISLGIVSKLYFENSEGVKDIISLKGIDNLNQKCLNVLRTVWHNASRDGLVTISNYLSTQANTLICSSVLGLVSAGAYGLTVQITGIISTVSTIPFASVQPAIQENALKNNKEQLTSLYGTSIVSFIVSFLLLSVISLFCIPILKFFKPTLEVDYLMFAAMLLSMIIYQLYHLAASFISSFNTLPYTKSFLISSIATVLFSYIFARFADFGVWSLIFSPFIVALLYNAWKWPLHSLKLIEAKPSAFLRIGWKNLMNRILKR